MYTFLKPSTFLNDPFPFKNLLFKYSTLKFFGHKNRKSMLYFKSQYCCKLVKLVCEQRILIKFK